MKEDAGLYLKQPKGEKNTEKDSASERTLIATQLDRIVNPPPISFRAHSKWLLKFRDRREFPNADLEDQLRHLDWAIPNAESDLEYRENPHCPMGDLSQYPMEEPPILTSAQWTKVMDQIDRMRGQRMAIRETLRLRSYAGEDTWQPSSEDLSSLGGDLDPDPFKDQ